MNVGRRIITPSAGAAGAAPVGVFLGLFGEAWLENAIASVEAQNVDRLPVVAALNRSTPSVLQRLTKWQTESRHHVTISINDRNLGPLGSWFRNVDLLDAQWVAVLHQDDVYLPRHTEVLSRAALEAPHDVLAVFSAMSGIDEDGQPVGPPPMDNHGLNMAPTTLTLPAILRRHPLPTPAGMFRNPGGYVEDLAWYDSGAPDSEWFARLACRGRFRVLDEVTVRYRTSVSSESQSTNWQSRAWQWANSLNRLIHSDDFARALENVSLVERNSFAKDLISAIPARYPESPIFDFLTFAAAQRIAAVWQYDPGPAVDLLANYLAVDPGSAAARNLAGITGSLAAGPACAAVHTVSQLLGEPPSRGRLEESGRAAYRRFGHLMPQRARMGAYRLYDRMWAHRGAR